EDRETAVSLLTHLEQNNLFLVPLDHERKWYRYHHLFRDFLRGQLATRDMKPRMLHARAAAWFGIQKMASAAISHWVQAAENKHALDLIESESMLVLMRGELATYHRWIAPFTQAELEQRPRLCLLQAWMVLISGDLEMAEIWLTKTETALADHQSVVDLDELKGQILTARTTIAASKRDIVHTIAYAEEALTRLPSTQTNFRALVNWNLAFAHRLQGNWKQSATLYRNAVRMAKASGNRVTAVFALSGLAHLLTHNSKFIEAETVFLQAIEMSSDADKRPLPIVSEPFVGYANLLRLQNRLDEAEKYAHIAIEMSEQLQHWDLMAISIVELGVIQYNQGHLNQAQARYETAVNLAATHQLIRSQDKISQLATLLNPPPPQMVETAVDALSDRELEVLHLVAAGYTNQQIADKLVVALSTAKWHIRNIYSKLHVENRTQAVATARHRNLID
ncbi:MAG: tetratricopeptide repeat protein, partial [Chloroflexi bacterium]|nr:tetratricopeptide repeat protein [Chloroflexota bacterium]